jgi:hypothetical protein
MYFSTDIAGKMGRFGTFGPLHAGCAIGDNTNSK